MSPQSLEPLEQFLVQLAVLALLLWPWAQPANAIDDARLLDILVSTYPDFLASHGGGVLVWKDGTRMPFDDGKPGKDFATLLDHPSLKDMFYAPYWTGKIDAPPDLNIDPGRVRYEPFFLKMYGDCRKGETAKTLVDVVWLPKKWGKIVKMTGVNGAAKQLTMVAAELDRLPPRFDKYLFPPAGTLNCRTIAGTTRLSAHGTATAIDISTNHSHYWQWGKPDAKGRYIWHNEIPMEIVEIFEKHGFIWGGKWYHYDTMHFEYRPDLIAAGRVP
jgi:D-alanyl-D-alanine carboxypeptidase